MKHPVVEAAEMVSCPTCNALGGSPCLIGKRKNQKNKELKPTDPRGPHPLRVELSRMIGLLKSGPQGQRMVNRQLTVDQQADVEMLAVGGGALARQYMADEDNRRLAKEMREAARVERERWVAKVRAGKGPKGRVRKF